MRYCFKITILADICMKMRYFYSKISQCYPGYATGFSIYPLNIRLIIANIGLSVEYILLSSI